MHLVTGIPLRATEQHEQVAPCRVVVRRLGEEIECIRVPADRVVGCERPHRKVARCARVVERLAEMIGRSRRRPVPGELGDARTRRIDGLDRLRDAAVQQCAPRRRQPRVLRVRDERVREGVSPGRDVGEQSCRRGRLELFQRVVVDSAGSAGERSEVELLADDRGDLQDAGAAVAQPGDAPVHDLPNAVGQARLVEVGARYPAPVVVEIDSAGLGEVPQQLGCKEWIAVTLAIHGVHEIERVGFELAARA